MSEIVVTCVCGKTISTCQCSSLETEVRICDGPCTHGRPLSRADGAS